MILLLVNKRALSIRCLQPESNKKKHVISIPGVFLFDVIQTELRSFYTYHTREHPDQTPPDSHEKGGLETLSNKPCCALYDVGGQLLQSKHRKVASKSGILVQPCFDFLITDM